MPLETIPSPYFLVPSSSGHLYGSGLSEDDWHSQSGQSSEALSLPVRADYKHKSVRLSAPSPSRHSANSSPFEIYPRVFVSLPSPSLPSLKPRRTIHRQTRHTSGTIHYLLLIGSGALSTPLDIKMAVSYLRVALYSKTPGHNMDFAGPASPDCAIPHSVDLQGHTSNCLIVCSRAQDAFLVLCAYLAMEQRTCHDVGFVVNQVQARAAKYGPGWDVRLESRELGLLHRLLKEGRW